MMAAAGVRVRVLGLTDAEVNGHRVDLGGPRQRSVLARLLVAHRTIVTADRVIDDVWASQQPRTAVTSLRAYVSRLRRLLEPDRASGESSEILVKLGAGYALRLEDDAVDAWRFEHLVEQAREASHIRPARSRVLLNEAFGLWQGHAYAEFADEVWAMAESARIEELCLSARELMVDVMLRVGAPTEAVAPAEFLTRAHPLREEGWRLLAVALWGSSRQADALAALRRSRRALAVQAGLDPGPALVRLEHAILAQRMDVLSEAVGWADSPSMAEGLSRSPAR